MKIEAGKFYRTANGEKVGPMQCTRDGKEFWSDLPFAMWRPDGMHFRPQSEDPFNLVAEWTDTPQPDADGWIKWEGGECPVPAGTLVKVRFRDRCEASRTALGVGYCAWEHLGMHRANDVVAYRIVSPKPAEPSPVRERTVKEIVPGKYGKISVLGRSEIRGRENQVEVCTSGFFTVPELRAAAATLTLIADALDDQDSAKGEA